MLKRVKAPRIYRFVEFGLTVQYAGGFTINYGQHEDVGPGSIAPAFKTKVALRSHNK